MSLRDAACYTLTLIPSLKDPTVLDLVENYNGPTEGERRQQARFSRVRERKEGEVYTAGIYDSHSTAKLASIGTETEKSKKKRLQLHGPNEDVSFEFTGMLSFEWTFMFEGNKYRWTRSKVSSEYLCALDRKPDPKVDICLAREADRTNPARLQILHYNIDRFPTEIKDLRGLETLIATTFVSFLDDIEARHPGNSPSPRPPITESSSSNSAPPLPPKPEKVISEEDFEPENPNEILVGLNTSIDEHVSRAVWLLEDPHVLFIVIRTRAAEATQRALEVSLGVTRFRHREGLDELKQYVIEEEPPKPQIPKSSPNTLGRGGPQVINLDAPKPLKESESKSPSPSNGSKKGTPDWIAPNIAIYMSKIDLPDLAPGRRESMKGKQSKHSGSNLSPTPSDLKNRPPPPADDTRPPPPQQPTPTANGGGKEHSLSKLFKAAAGRS